MHNNWSSRHLMPNVNFPSKCQKGCGVIWNTSVRPCCVMVLKNLTLFWTLYDRINYVCVIKWWRVKLGNNFTRALSTIVTISRLFPSEYRSQSLVSDKLKTLIIDLELRALKTLELFESFLVCCFVRLGFLKRLLMPVIIFIHNILKLRHHLGTETYGRFPW